MDKKLSVLVITYNQEKYISKTIDSILEQKISIDFEIVIGDDCSQDNTPQILRNYEEKFPGKVRVIYNQLNMGLIKNYFNVFRNCNGKYIMVCAGDDFWLPGKIESQIAYMESNPGCGLCYGNALIVNEKDEFTENCIGGASETTISLLENNLIPAVTVCYRKDLMENYISEINPENQTWHMEDYPAWLWFSKNCEIKYINKPLAAYRVLENSASRPASIEKQFSYSVSVRNVRNFFSKLYNIPYKIVSDKEILYFLYFDELKKVYSKEIANKMCDCIEYTGVKWNIKKMIFKNPILFNLYLNLYFKRK